MPPRSSGTILPSNRHNTESIGRTQRNEAAGKAHRFRPRQIEHDGEQQVRQDRGGRGAGAADRREIEHALAGIAALALRQGDAGRFEEAVDGVLRRADARTAPLLDRIRLHRRQIGNDQDQSPRRDEALRLGGVETGAGELVTGETLQIPAARVCIRAGISSVRISSRRSGISPPPRRRARLRSTPSPARAPGRYRRRAPSPK